MTLPSRWTGWFKPSRRLESRRVHQEFDEAQRREIFRSLVELQDREPSVSKSRSQIARQFTLTDRQLRRIEDEGIDNDWPPL